MVIILKEKTTKEQKEQLVKWFEGQGLKVHESEGEYKTILGLVGDVASVDKDMVGMLDIVERVTPISEPYKNANRKFHPKDTEIVIRGGKSESYADLAESGGSADPAGSKSYAGSSGAGGTGSEDAEVKIGGGSFAVFAGPSCVGSLEQTEELAEEVKKSGADVLFGGTVRRLRTPHSGEVPGSEVYGYLASAKRKACLPSAAELISIEDLKDFDDVDVIQVGARNMQNYEMLRELGRIGKPVIIQRGLANTMEELIMSAEYVMAGGNPDVILCESGIRTFEQYTKSTLDMSAIPALKKRTHLPVIVAPGQATGYAELVGPMSIAAAAAGADGLIIEVHTGPQHSMSEGAWSVTPESFGGIMEKVRRIREVL